jgi:hypothetical protein
VENVVFLLPLLVTFVLVAGVVLKKSLAGDPTLREKSQMFSEP